MRIVVEIRNRILSVRAFYEEGEPELDITNFLPTYREVANMIGIQLGTRGTWRFSRRIPNGDWDELLDFILAQTTSEELARVICFLIVSKLKKLLQPAIFAAHTTSDSDFSIGISDNPAPRLIIGNKIYRLVLEGIGSDVDAIEEIRNELKKQVEDIEYSARLVIKEYKEEWEKRIAELQRKIDEMTVMPILSKDDLRNDVRAWIEKGTLCVSMPFNYTPKFIRQQEGETEIFRKINPRVAKELERKVWICFYINSGVLFNIILYNDPLCEKEFFHYHTRCWGTFRIPERPLNIPGDLYTIRSQLERELEIINLSSIADSEPVGLPSIRFLHDNSVKIETSPWDIEEAKKESEVEEDREAARRGGRNGTYWSL